MLRDSYDSYVSMQKHPVPHIHTLESGEQIPKQYVDVLTAPLFCPADYIIVIKQVFLPEYLYWFFTVCNL